MSKHQREDTQLAASIQEAYQSCRQVYGSPRIHAELRAQGIMSSRKRVARLMREQGLSACRRHRRTTTTKSEPGARVAPHLLDQDFTATRPDEKWTGDITAVWTYEGWLYLAVVLAEIGITVSMSRTGNCYDNAVTQSFFGTLKGECVDRACFQTRGQARQSIFEYAECFYNRVRRHSSLGYASPVAYEQSMG